VGRERAPSQDGRRGRAVVLLAAAVLPVLLAGCIEPQPDFAHGPQVEEGTGYHTIVVDPRTSLEVVEAALSPDRQTLALLFSNGDLQLWGANGTRVSAWHLAADASSCVAVRGCGVSFLPNSTLLAFFDSNLSVLNLEGHQVWNWSAAPAHHGIRWMEPADDGRLLVLAFNDGTAQVRNTLTGEEFPVPVAGNMTPPDVSASETAGIVGTAGTTAGFYNPAGDLVAESPRGGDVEVAGDGRTAAVWGHDFEGNGLLDVGDLTVTPGTWRNVRVDSTSNLPQFGADRTDRLFLSNNGRYAAVHARFSTFSCQGDVCSSGIRDFVRVVDLTNLSRELGFGAVAPIRVFLADDGSAIAVSSVPLPNGGFRTEFTFAAVGATPPRFIPPPPVI
jgi:hypothetical protein